MQILFRGSIQRGFQAILASKNQTKIEIVEKILQIRV
jgi:hypothetical protein